MSEYPEPKNAVQIALTTVGIVLTVGFAFGILVGHLLWG